MQDKKIVELFFQRSEDAINELKSKYGNLILRTSNNILHSPRDAEECLNDSLLAVWNSIPPNDPDNLGAYFARIARNISISKYRSLKAKKRNSEYDRSLDELSECVPSPENVEMNMQLREITGMIEDYLDTVSKENSAVFVMRYFLCMSLREISSRSGISEKNLSVRLFRIRKGLREYLERRGVM